jgi:hypothetical protein
MAYLLSTYRLKSRNSAHIRLMKFGARLKKTVPSYHNIYEWDGYDNEIGKTMFFDDDEVSYRYELVASTEEMNPSMGLISTPAGWMKLVCKFSKKQAEREAS